MAKPTPPKAKKVKPTNTAGISTDPVFTEVMDKFNASREYMKKGFLPMWKDVRDLYNNNRVDINYIGSSDTFVPETFTIIQAVKSNVVGGKIKIDYLPTRKDQTGDIRVLNALNDQNWVDDKTKLKDSWAVEDALVTGNGYLWQYWGGRYACNKYVPTEDNWFDVDATSYENLGHGGYRYLTTIDKLKEEKKINTEYEEENPDSLMHVDRFQNLDDINSYDDPKNQWKLGNDKTAKQLREEMIAGAVLGQGTKTDDIVEVIVYIDKEKQVRIANRCVLIENIPTPFKRDKSTVQSVDDQGQAVSFELPEIKPFIPVSPFRDYTDGALWYARGEIEVIGELQELLNDTQNQKSDNLNYTLNRMWTLDPSQAHKIDEIQSVPGAVFTVPAGSLVPLTTGSIGADADNEMFRIQSMMRRATAADELIQGSSGKGDTTATEVNATIAQAGSRFASKLENFESEGFTIQAQNMFKINQIFMTTEQAVRMIGQDGIEWKSYNPGEFLGDYDVKVSLDSTARVLKEEEKQNALQFYLMASKQGFVDQQKLFKITASTLFDKDDNDIDGLILQQMAPPPPPIKQPSVSISLKDVVEPTARAALLAQAITNDPAPEPPTPTVPAIPGETPQSGMGTLASAPQGDAGQAAIVDSQNQAGLNVEGMPQA